MGNSHQETKKAKIKRKKEDFNDKTNPKKVIEGQTTLQLCTVVSLVTN
jgi:hypothetical protein